MAKIFASVERLFTQIQRAYNRFVEFLFLDCDATALGLFRILFGLCMFLDVFQERGLDDADIRFGDPNYCFFPLFSVVRPVSVQYACIIYSFMWIGSLGILFGYKFRLSCFLYLFPFLYFLALDKSRWNNHSYLFTLTVILLSGSDATKFGSLDAYLSVEETRKCKCPKWNYFILKFQFTLLYFFAAVKKIDMDWLSGYSMRNISKHKILYPIAQIVGEEFLDFYVIHIGGFFFDLSAGFLLNCEKTKKLAFLSSFLFHGLNSQLFEIGMFPYVCLASLILFCSPQEFPVSWFSSEVRETGLSKHSDESLNAKLQQKRTKINLAKTRSRSNSIPDQGNIQRNQRKQNWITSLLISYMSLQIMLPFTHSITKGYNNWTNGLYGYSWDMMCHSWDTLHTKITVKDYVTNEERFLDPDVWTTNDRWSSHADMAKQYAHCIARNLANFNITTIEVYFDVWKSLNGRFQQRIFDPRVDILQAPWSPWENVPWVLPLLQEFSHWRRKVFTNISKEVANWTKSSNVIFVADYPGLTLENYLPPQLSNISLTLMKGEILVEQKGMENVTLRNMKESGTDFEFSVQKNRITILADAFHKIHTISALPSSYMYTYTNHTEDSGSESNGTENLTQKPFCVQIIDAFKSFLEEKTSALTRSFFLIVNSYLNLLFDVPMVIRKNVDGV